MSDAKSDKKAFPKMLKMAADGTQVNPFHPSQTLERGSKPALDLLQVRLLS